MQQQGPPPSYLATQPQGNTVQQQVVTVQPGAQDMTRSQTQAWKGLKSSGIMQLVLGILTIVLGVVTLVLDSFFSIIGAPIWCGLLFYGVAGILGIISGSIKNQGVAIGYMVMSILACMASCVVIGFAAAAVPLDIYGYGCRRYNCSGILVALDAALIIMGLMEFVVAIVGSSMTCSVMCSAQPTHTVIHYQQQPQMIMTGQPQGNAYYTAPQPQQQHFNPAYPPQQLGNMPPQGQFQAPPPQAGILPGQLGNMPPQGQFQAPPPQAGNMPPKDQFQAPPYQASIPPGQVAPPTSEHVYQPLIK